MKTSIFLGIALVLLIIPLMGSKNTTTTLLPSTGRLILPVNTPFKCGNYQQPMNFDLVKATINADYTGTVDDAINLNRGDCTGNIARLECDTYVADCVKVGETAHDLTIGGGYVYCHARRNPKHQDGFQFLGGSRITVHIDVVCLTSNNAAWFLTPGANASTTPTPRDWPTDVVCVDCTLEGGAQTVSIAGSIRSGVKDSRVYTGHFTAARIQSIAVNPVYTNNLQLPCQLPPCP
jgi:hypothetical protein